MAIGTAGAIALGVTAAAGLGGAALQANAASKAAGAQGKAAKSQLALQREIFEQTKANQQPFVEGGHLANAALLYELGLGDAPTIGGTTQFRVGERTFDNREAAEEFLRFEQNRFIEANRPRPQIVANERDGGFNILSATPQQVGQAPIYPGGFDPYGVQVEDISTPGRTFGGFQETQDYTFGLNEGIRAVDASAAAAGSLNSGATLQALNEFGQNFASLRRAEYLNRLGGLSGAGQNATNALASSAQAFGVGAGNALASLGNARAAGAIGQGNAFASGLNTIGSLAGMFTGLGGGGGVNPAVAATKVNQPLLAF